MEVGIEEKDKVFVERIKEATIKSKLIDRVVKKALATKEGGWERLGTLIEWQKHIYVLKDKKL